ncbi:hypothetical protein PR202_gb17885 [Eleusine coracana subsp. coracana]|uniref:Tryptophan synthase beta chain-like PALP domain-containing protein n=1 Tax=Eleusine coracana subsp. coracana TaxID=191504 RepID=A0AAV5F481_ELECO|nr:hypothetical protein PR202_gb17885 [Eleusine coracana subsp. coracana]
MRIQLKLLATCQMIEDAEEKGLISPGVTTLVEPTSGNMGISLAYIAMLRGYRFIAVMPAEYSLDKQILLRYLGTELVLTGPEIWNNMAGKIDIFVSGSGTGGTVSGVGKYLKMKNPAVKVICVEPAESPVISGGKPSRHKIQGVGPGFVPKNLDTSLIDEIVTVTAEDAMNNAQRLAREEGLLVGISSGANLSACLKVASREESKGRMIVTMFPSGGERYMNSDLFAAKPRIMEGEKVGRRGIPSLLMSSSSSSKSGDGQDEHIASDVTQLIGWTPLIELKRITCKDGIDARVIGKIEAYQPLCSVKDRCALGMIEDAEERGLISPGVTTLVEPTGGNTGLGLVLIAIHKGYRFVAVMPGQYSLDKQMLLTYMGAELFLTGPEIWRDTAGKVDIFVASSGTGGGPPGKHKIEGVGPGFLPEVFDISVIDEVVTVTTEEAMVNARRLAKEEGLLLGISSGANLAASFKVALRKENKGKMIVTIFPSGGERYMNSDLFATWRCYRIYLQEIRPMSA